MRLADLLAGLSRLADLGFGLPMGTALRSCVLATHLARSLELPPSGVQAAFYTALLHHVGCAGYARETARLFGDELVTNMAAGRTDAASFRDVFKTFLPTLTQGRPVPERARLAFIAFTKAVTGATSSLAPPASSGGTPPGGCNCPRTSRSACSMSTTSGGARLGPERWKARTSPLGRASRDWRASPSCSSPSAGAVSRCRPYDAAQAACSTRAWWLASRTMLRSGWPAVRRPARAASF